MGPCAVNRSRNSPPAASSSGLVPLKTTGAYRDRVSMTQPLASRTASDPVRSRASLQLELDRIHRRGHLVPVRPAQSHASLATKQKAS